MLVDRRLLRLRVFRATRDFDDQTFRAIAFDAPGVGASVVVPVADGSANATIRESLLSGITAAGLTMPEREAFAHAWRDAIVPEPDAGSDHSRYRWPERASLVEPARPPADALYYWLPVSAADAALRIEATPPPTAIRRALLVRIGLSPPDPDPVAGAAPYLHVRLVEPTTATGISSELVRRVIRRHANELRFCAESVGIATTTDAQYELSITVDGRVSAVSIHVGAGLERFARCAEVAFRRWTFPAPDVAPATASGGFDLAPAPSE